MQENPTGGHSWKLPGKTFYFSLLFHSLTRPEEDQAMPVLDTERRSATRSALRYRPIDTDQAYKSGPVTIQKRRSRSDAQTTTANITPDDLDLDEEEKEQLPPRRRATTPDRHQQGTTPRRPKRRFHPLLFVGIGLLTTILLWTAITQAMVWGTNEFNTLKYGYPRTYQTDAVVGQGDSIQHPSHFIAVNLHGIVTIIEFPSGDPGRARELASSNVLGQNADLAVITLRFVDLNHNGKPDMVVDIDGVQSVLINNGTTFRPPTPAEQQQLLQELQQTK